MKKIAFVFIIIFVAIDILFIVLGYFSKSGEPAGLADGVLAKCPAKPNCVCSEKINDAVHYIDPIIISQKSSDETMKIIKDTIKELGGTIQTETGLYLAATFSSAIFGFIDDIEIRIDSTNNLIHIRSASRVGYGDLGANKKRTELIKDLYNKKIKSI
ncbi:MAG: DUF1499 domain-containing protein [Proteobacteria bacterium]|nr:DUF1499 domain-containing protein [Pseudomonadota bacterium]